MQCYWISFKENPYKEENHLEEELERNNTRKKNERERRLNETNKREIDGKSKQKIRERQSLSFSKKENQIEANKNYVRGSSHDQQPWTTSDDHQPIRKIEKNLKNKGFDKLHEY